VGAGEDGAAAANSKLAAGAAAKATAPHDAISLGSAAGSQELCHYPYGETEDCGADGQNTDGDLGGDCDLGVDFDDVNNDVHLAEEAVDQDGDSTLQAEAKIAAHEAHEPSSEQHGAYWDCGEVVAIETDVADGEGPDGLGEPQGPCGKSRRIPRSKHECRGCRAAPRGGYRH
jgi:hypothetical protein